MAAAFELSNTPELRARFQVTVYQLGWRLGGKGASSRNPARQGRIEEHGLHVWGGYYENAFRVMRTCYDEIERAEGAPLSTFERAFLPHGRVTWAERLGERWVPWTVDLERNDAIPGDGTSVPEPAEYLALLVPWMVRFFRASRAQRRGRPRTGRPVALPTWLRTLIRAAIRDDDADPDLPGWQDPDLVRWRDRYGGPCPSDPADPDGGPDDDPLASEGLLLESAALLARRIGERGLGLRQLAYGLVWLLDRFMDQLWAELGGVLDDDDLLRRVAIVLDLAAAYVRGLIADDVLDRGFDVIDGYDYAEWLERHGARPQTLASPAVRGAYDYYFSYEDGDPDRPRIAAGAALRSIFRLLFTYKGAIFWKLQAGMGETVFSPMYEALVKRGVRFVFFHPVRDLVPDQSDRRIQRIVLGRQATVTAGADAYDPLVDVHGVPCWQHAPDPHQLVEGQALAEAGADLESPWSGWQDVEQVELVRGRDFDEVVLAIPPAAARPVAGRLVAARRPWRQMLVGLRTVPTQNLQLWLRPDTEAMGWTDGNTVLTGFAKPFDTWADFTHTLDAEQWTGPDAPRSVAYMCAALHELEPPPGLDDRSYVGAQFDRVFDNARHWLEHQAAVLWPAAALRDDPAMPGFDWTLLAGAGTASGPEALASQFWRANVNPGDRYTLALPGTTRLRMSADGSGYDNLFLAGDWVRTGMNIGCVESAVISGAQAARAIAGGQWPIVGESDFP